MCSRSEDDEKNEAKVTSSRDDRSRHRAQAIREAAHRSLGCITSYETARVGFKGEPGQCPTSHEDVKFSDEGTWQSFNTGLLVQLVTLFDKRVLQCLFFTRDASGCSLSFLTSLLKHDANFEGFYSQRDSTSKVSASSSPLTSLLSVFSGLLLGYSDRYCT